MPKIKKINQEFESGYIPNELFYALPNKRDIDITKITYNSYYNSFEYHSKKLPYYNSIPGLDMVINHIAENTLSPLQELELKINSLNINNNE